MTFPVHLENTFNPLCTFYGSSLPSILAFCLTQWFHIFLRNPYRRTLFTSVNTPAPHLLPPTTQLMISLLLHICVYKNYKIWDLSSGREQGKISDSLSSLGRLLSSDLSHKGRFPRHWECFNYGSWEDRYQSKWHNSTEIMYTLGHTKVCVSVIYD